MRLNFDKGPGGDFFDFRAISSSYSCAKGNIQFIYLYFSLCMARTFSLEGYFRRNVRNSPDSSPPELWKGRFSANKCQQFRVALSPKSRPSLLNHPKSAFFLLPLSHLWSLRATNRITVLMLPGVFSGETKSFSKYFNSFPRTLHTL